MLYIFGGLPGTGKTELSRYLSQSINAVYIRIDTIEQELKNCGVENLFDESYKIAFALAHDNLKNGLCVVADSTNPVKESREGWVNIAVKACSPYTEIEILCSNKTEHKNRVESRISDIPNLVLPNWESVVCREYQLWETPRVVLDTANKTPEQSKKELRSAIRSIV